MFICVYVGIIRNIVYYIMIINRGYLFIYIYSISVVGDLVYNKMVFILILVIFIIYICIFKVMLFWFWNKDVGIRIMILMSLYLLFCIMNV